MINLLLNIHIFFYKRSPKKEIIEIDVDHWKEILQWEGSYSEIIKKLLLYKPEFRNLFYYRLGGIRIFSTLMHKIAPPLPTLYIWTEDIGPGLFIQHGFATVIAAKKIGKHCFVNQQVTIGYNGNYAPIIGDNVMITCGAKVIGKVKVGNNVKIGANAVVVKDVPDNVTVVGVPAYIIKRGDKRVNENL